MIFLTISKCSFLHNFGWLFNPLRKAKNQYRLVALYFHNTWAGSFILLPKNMLRLLSLQHNEREMFTQLLKFPTEYPPSIGGVIENSMKKNVNRYYAAIFLHLGYVVAPTCFFTILQWWLNVENALKTGVRSIIISI